MAHPDQLQSPARVKVIIFGATGMIGTGALLECFADPRVERVMAVVRKPSGVRHAAYRRITFDLTMAAARSMAVAHPVGYPTRVLEGRDINVAGAPA